jgi:flagellum-specific ATP synthase
MAQREVGLAIGEPPATRGYTPSVFAMLPRLLERAGTSTSGSITGLYTVLVDGDDMNEPIADAARSILDGHIVLSRSLAHAGHYPAIDILQSVSRLIGEIVSAEVAEAGQLLRGALAVLHEKEDLVAIGAYQPGTDERLDAAIAHKAAIEAFLRQPVQERSTPGEADALLLELAGSLSASLRAREEQIEDAEEVPEPVATGAAESLPAAGGGPAIPPLGLSI